MPPAAVKHEPCKNDVKFSIFCFTFSVSREELLSTLVQQHANREQLLSQSWLNTAAVPPTMGLLNALVNREKWGRIQNVQIQQQQAAAESATAREPLLIETTTGIRLAAIQEEQNPQQPPVGAADIQRLFEAGRNVCWKNKKRIKFFSAFHGIHGQHEWWQSDGSRHASGR